MQNSFKRKKVDNKTERQIITGMIVSDHVLKEIESIYKSDLLETPFARTIAGWCIDYWKRYKKAPKEVIEDIFHSHSRKDLDADQADLIGDFLTSISSEYEKGDKFNAHYVLDKAEEKFKETSLKHLSEDIKAELTNGDVRAAEALLATYKRIERLSGEGIVLFQDASTIYDAFDMSKPLFRLPGTLGEMLNDFLVRDGLLGVMGKEKIGKTWILMEIAFRALRERLNVAFFQVGDMSGPQMIRRCSIRLAGKSDKKKYCGNLLVPVIDCLHNQKNKCTSTHRASECGLVENATFEDTPKEYKPCSYCQKRYPHIFKGAVWYRLREKVDPLTWREAYQQAKRFKKKLRGKNLKLSSHSNSTVNIQDIKTILNSWEAFDGFIPDVIIIDYADILKPEPGSKEFRHQQNDTWKALRSLSQEKHNLVITATQTDAASYDRRSLSLKNFSEDKRKYSHVTGMIGLNQTDEEKEKGILRVNMLLGREDDFNAKTEVNVLQCPQIGRMMINSYW